MTITSFGFLVLISIGAAVYYILPKALQWMELLLLSLIFYYFAATPYTIIYLVVSTLTAYASTMIMQKIRAQEKCERKETITFWITIAALVINISIWIVIKGRFLWVFFAERILAHIYIPVLDSLLNVQLVAAIGIGYYTLQVLGYVIDCYWENVTPQKNPLKLFLFVSYFPQLIAGPISRYAQLNTLFEKHKFKYQNVAFGAQRILWGFIKKIVLAERVGMIVSAISENSDIYVGFYSWIVILLFPLQLYADFSGCMDIVLGVSELFDIHLAENFKNPFFSRSSQEFWQRWHITLGAWAKDYILYPLLKSNFMVRFGKYAKKKFGKKAGKFIVNAIGIFVLWLILGIWHGGLKYIVGVGLWYWIILMSGDLFSSVFTKITESLHMKTESFGWHLFQSGRTYLLYAVGASIFNVGISDGISLLKDAGAVIWKAGYANPWIFFDGSILEVGGVTYGDINIIILVVLMLIIVAIIREKYGYARIWIQAQSFLFRWGIWIGLFLLVLIYGKYGPGYNAADFIYQGF